MEQIEEVEGFVIHKRPYKESGYLVDLLSNQHGLIRVLLRRSALRRAPVALELFIYGRWFLKAGRIFYFLHDYEPLMRYPLRGRAIWSGYYLNELIIRLSPREIVDELLFERYAMVLHQAYQREPLAPALRQFEQALLESLGIFPDLEVDQGGSVIDPHHFYYLTTDEGLSPYRQFGALELPGTFIQSLNHDAPLSEEEEGLHKQMMRFLITPLLGDRPLQSRLWLQKLYYSQQRPRSE